MVEELLLAFFLVLAVVVGAVATAVEAVVMAALVLVFGIPAYLAERLWVRMRFGHKGL